MNVKLKLNKKRLLAIIMASVLTLSTVAIIISKTAKKDSAIAATGRPIASNNIPDGEVGYIKLTKTATTTSIKDVWKIELGVSGKNADPTFVEVMMVIDTSKSMNELSNQEVSSQVYDRASRIYGAKDAAKALVESFWTVDNASPLAHNPSMYRIGTYTMGFELDYAGALANVDTFDIMDSWKSVAPLYNTANFSWAPQDLEHSLNGISGKASIPSSVTSVLDNTLYTYKDQDAMLNNIRILHAPASYTSMGIAVNEALAKQYYDGSNYGTALVDPPIAAKRKQLELLKAPENRANVIVKRALVLVSDGVPTDAPFLDASEFVASGGSVENVAGWEDFTNINPSATMFNGDSFAYVNAHSPGSMATDYSGNGFMEEGPLGQSYALIKHFQAISTKTTPTSVYMVGLGLPESGPDTYGDDFFNDVVNIAPVQFSDAQYKNFTGSGSTRAEALSKYFLKIADDLKTPKTNAIVYDQLGEEFDLYHFDGNSADAEVEYSYWPSVGAPELTPQLSPNIAGAPQTEKYFTYNTSAKTFEWRIDNFADYSDPDTMTYYIKLKAGLNLPDKTYATNNYAYIDYTNANGIKAVKFFPHPFVTMDGIVETPSPKDEFPEGSEWNDVGGYVPTLPSEGWNTKAGGKTTTPKVATVTKEEAAAKAAGKTLEEIAAEKKAAKEAVDAKAKESKFGLTNEEVRAQEDQKIADLAQKAYDTAQANVETTKAAAEKTKTALAAAKANKSSTPEQISKLEAAAKSAKEKANAAKASAEKALRNLDAKKAKLKNSSLATPTPSPTPSPTPELTPIPEAK